MKILKLSTYFDPEMGGSGYLGKDIFAALAESNFEMDVYAPVPSRGVTEEVRKEYSKMGVEKWFDGKIRIHRFPMFRERKNNFQRAFRYLCCGIIEVLIGLTRAHYDVLFLGSSPPSNGIIEAIIHKIRKIPVVFCLQDIFSDSLVNTQLAAKGSMLWRFGWWIEKITYKNADKIIVLSEGFKQNLILKQVPEEKIEVVYNWIDENEVIPIDRGKNDLFDKYSLDRKKFYVVYSGNIGFTQNLTLLLDVAKEFKKNKDIEFVIIGDGADRSSIERMVNEEGILNVKLLPFQPYEDISKVFSLADVGLVISKKNVGQSSVPSKTWSIMAAERAVLASFDLGSELCQIIQKADCGVCVAPENKEALEEAILNLYKNRSSLTQFGKNGRKYILEHLSKEKGTSAYVRILKQFEKA